MLFRRRQPEAFVQRLRYAFWPRRSWSRSLTYLKKRVLRLRATPHAIAGGFAIGVFATCTPLFGLHIVMACALAYILSANVAAAALGCLVGNPLTYPLIWGATYEIGRYVLHAEIPDGQTPSALGESLRHMDVAAIWEPYLKPMLIGTIPVGAVLAGLGYVLVYFAARSYQQARLRRTHERHLPGLHRAEGRP